MIRKHSVNLRGHKTSFSLEDEFWAELNGIAKTTGLPIGALLQRIDENRDEDTNFSSAIRLFVLKALKAQAEKR
ncbi:ribbon-helix-helix domain-containing protein [Rhizobium sp. L1K21]|uniref:ribbon-helix-helix domain-containing protein n=1 Tax=Rhizobium sp. L1K21 TaxID=2954933 RepID=UPI002093AC6F|nr:ribbon-helix-helix domain-containing protein [Rhizobium sp. L1K21]MCO6185697.1 ribbon-helix-helix domain-containing protein [Rhizobium sp. L1K21]